MELYRSSRDAFRTSTPAGWGVHTLRRCLQNSRSDSAQANVSSRTPPTPPYSPTATAPGWRPVSAKARAASTRRTNSARSPWGSGAGPRGRSRPSAPGRSTSATRARAGRRCLERARPRCGTGSASAGGGRPPVGDERAQQVDAQVQGLGRWRVDAGDTLRPARTERADSPQRLRRRRGARRPGQLSLSVLSPLTPAGRGPRCDCSGLLIRAAL